MATVFLQGDCLARLKGLADETVYCCVTSPPYWGLRDYQTAKWEGGDPKCDHQELRGGVGAASAKQVTSAGASTMYQYRDTCGKCGARRVDAQMGLEKTPEEYVAHLVEVFREVKRVLRPDGTLWLNLGDSYAGSGKGAWENKDGGQKEVYIPDPDSQQCLLPKVPKGLKPKDLVGIPWRVAFALQDDGWWLRSDIIWHKPNTMPSSVSDRCTTSHEYVFLLAKSPCYFYDAEAIKEPATAGEHTTTRKSFGGQAAGAGVTPSGNQVPGTAWSWGSSRNRRDVWTISTKPFPGAHFATFPPDLIEPMIKAGCPKQCCPTCGKGWDRVVEREKYSPEIVDVGVRFVDVSRHDKTRKLDGKSKEWRESAASRCTIGFRPACKCGKTHSIPGTVLDPFGGAGTTGLVANSLGRNCILIELNKKYIKMARKRLGRRLLLRKTESGYTPVSEIPPLIDL